MSATPFNHVDLLDLFQPGPSKVPVVDPILKEVGSLWIPMESIAYSSALLTCVGPDSRPGYLCLQYQKGRCFAEQNCALVHVDRDYLCTVRSVLTSLPLSTCCLEHGDLPSRRPDCQALMTRRAIEIFEDNCPATFLSPQLVAVTAYRDTQKNLPLDQPLKVRAKRICRLHQEDRCRLGSSCGNVHLCRQFWTLRRRLLGAQGDGTRAMSFFVMPATDGGPELAVLTGPASQFEQLLCWTPQPPCPTAADIMFQQLGTYGLPTVVNVSPGTPAYPHASPVATEALPTTHDPYARSTGPGQTTTGTWPQAEGSVPQYPIQQLRERLLGQWAGHYADPMPDPMGHAPQWPTYGPPAGVLPGPMGTQHPYHQCPQTTQQFAFYCGQQPTAPYSAAGYYPQHPRSATMSPPSHAHRVLSQESSCGNESVGSDGGSSAAFSAPFAAPMQYADVVKPWLHQGMAPQEAELNTGHLDDTHLSGESGTTPETFSDEAPGRCGRAWSVEEASPTTVHARNSISVLNFEKFPAGRSPFDAHLPRFTASGEFEQMRRASA